LDLSNEYDCPRLSNNKFENPYSFRHNMIDPTSAAPSWRVNQTSACRVPFSGTTLTLVVS
jgi:hypothetical protein